MDLSMTRQNSYGITPMVVGSRMSATSADLAFAIFAVCGEIAPERRRGEVRFGDVLLMTGPTGSDLYAAQRVAEAALKSRLAALFSDKQPPTLSGTNP